MSLFHISDKLNQLSSRLYNTKRDIPKILHNYFFYTRNLTFEIAKGINQLRVYAIKRVSLWQKKVGLDFNIQEMPGEQARSQFWTDPRIEFGIQNRRRR